MARSSERISFRSSCVAGRRSSKASAIRSRSDSAPAPAPRTISSTASCARSRPICADPTVAWIVRSTASRTASGTCWLGRLAIAPGVSHIVRRMLDSGPIHLKPATELAERVLLPGDPHRALAVAQALTEQPKMFNHHRGLWGYTGEGRDGEPLTVQATGMGGPSAAIVIEELIALGAKTLIRIGTCGALTDAHSIGELVVPEVALALDGTSRGLGADGRVLPDPELAAACAVDAPNVVAASVDVFYGDPETGDADVVEMECATLFQVAKLRGVRAAAVLGVSDTLGAERRRICAEHLEALGLQLGEAAWAALTR